MNSLIVIHYNDIDKIVWDKFVENSNDGWLYHTTQWIDYFSLSYENYSFGIKQGNKLLAVCPLYLIKGFAPYSKNPIYKQFQRVFNKFCKFILDKHFFEEKILLSGYSGPAFSNDIGRKYLRSIKRKMMSYVDEIAKDMCVNCLELRFVDLSPSMLPPIRSYVNPFWDVGVCTQYCTPPRLFAYVDLSKDIEIIRKNIDEDCRCEINKAKALGVSFRVGTKDDVDKYHSIHSISWRRTAGFCLPVETYRGMYDSLCPNMNIKLLFAQSKDEDVATVMLHLYKEAVFYWGGASLEKALELRANNYLLFNAIKWSKENGYKWFGVGLFDVFPGKNLKEYNVGRYKAQFTKDYFTSYEAKKYYKLN